jgi:ABC-type Fe3+ transport system substrate-binding protein
VPLEPVVVIINTVSITSRPAHPAAAKLFIDFLFSKSVQLKLREMSRIPARSDVEPDPPRLIKGFTMVIQEIENEHTFDSIKLFQQIFGLTPG